LPWVARLIQIDAEAWSGRSRPQAAFQVDAQGCPILALQDLRLPHEDKSWMPNFVGMTQGRHRP
jgi:hypothetical protein